MVDGEDKIDNSESEIPNLDSIPLSSPNQSDSELIGLDEPTTSQMNFGGITTDNFKLVSFCLLFYTPFHDEQSPFIHKVKLASSPFWGSTLFVSIPFGITNTNAKKKMCKSLHKKKLDSYFQSAAGSEPKYIQN